MKEQLWLTGDQRNFDFFSDDELLLTENDLTEQKETTEQTEQTDIAQLNDGDIGNFFPENRNRIEANCKITIFFVVE